MLYSIVKNVRLGNLYCYCARDLLYLKSGQKLIRFKGELTFDLQGLHILNRLYRNGRQIASVLECFLPLQLS